MLKLKLTQTYYREVETIEKASREVRLYVDLFDLSASDYEDCELFNKQGHKLGRFSYNGRFWPESEVRA
jgi:hypothetical protein